MIKVCDCIMGSGKSQSAIAYMNEHKDKKFVYVTPYLDEATRIVEACPDLDFKEPSDAISEFDFSKVSHTRYLLSLGHNIASTHAALRSYTKDMLDNIRKFGYTLIIDEAMDVFHEAEYKAADIRLLQRAGFFNETDDGYEWTGLEYEGGKLTDLYLMLRCSNLMKVSVKGEKTRFYYWAVPIDVLRAFSDTIVLTYLFHCQEFKYFLDIYGEEYKYIGILKEGDSYRFTEDRGYIPEYVPRLKEMIHIFDNEKINSIGDGKKAISKNWFKDHPEEVKQLKNNLYNYFRNYRKCGVDPIMWGTYKNCAVKLRGKGYTNQHLVFNQKATNEFRDRTSLAYCVNIFQRPSRVKFFREIGITYDEDGYALSTMIQWIWRSAIRDGKEIWIYIPSRRMRELLIGWIEKVTKEAVIHG